MSINVLHGGLLTTIQDLGRVGFQKYGVVTSGAMDFYALRIANLLVGNEEGEAGIEVTLVGPVLKIEEDVLIAITGGDLSPTINGEPVPLWKPIVVKRGSIIKFGPCKTGCRSYIAVGGGFDLPEVMGSRSTYLRAQIGGLWGRALEKRDSLALRAPSKFSLKIQRYVEENGEQLWSAKIDFKTNQIQVIIGSHYRLFTDETRQDFFQKMFTITPQSDRMGYRLSGPCLKLSHSFEMVSEAVSLGTIQVPADGNPIILLADRQTTGGYPRIGHVIKTDVPLLAQMKPGEQIQFQEVTHMEAEHIYRNKERDMNLLRMGLLSKIKCR